MKFTLEYIPKVTWEPDTDKWRLFPVDEFEEDSSGLGVVMKWILDDDEIIYMVDYEADSIVEGFNKGYGLIMEYIGETENDLC